LTNGFGYEQPLDAAGRRFFARGSLMDVRIVVFPETKVAAVEHFGAPDLEHQTAKRLIAWRLQHRLLDRARHRSYGVHYTDPQRTPPSEHHVDFCLSIDGEVGPNALGVVDKVIPASRCALARDVGSRYDNKAAVYLYENWLPRSGEAPGRFPMIFHYVNVGPDLREEDMITDVYLPLM
jgi:AraC family transcriptional regulator